MQMAGGGSGFLAAAQQGMFAVDTVAGDEMVRSIKQMRQRLNDRLQQLDALKVQAKLGNLPEASAIAEFNVLVASGDEQSLDYVLRRLAEALEEAQHALEVGMRNYAEIEAEAEQSFRRIGPE